ncbi:hypothetical protein HpCK98_02750 [Helicobacter pylori]
MQPNKKAQDKSSVFFVSISIKLGASSSYTQTHTLLNGVKFSLSFIPLTPKDSFLRDYLLDLIKLLYLILKNAFEYFY